MAEQVIAALPRPPQDPTAVIMRVVCAEAVEWSSNELTKMFRLVENETRTCFKFPPPERKTNAEGMFLGFEYRMQKAAAAIVLSALPHGIPVKITAYHEILVSFQLQDFGEPAPPPVKLIIDTAYFPRSR